MGMVSIISLLGFSLLLQSNQIKVHGQRQMDHHRRNLRRQEGASMRGLEERNLLQCTDVEVEIQFDNYAYETSWRIEYDFPNQPFPYPFATMDSNSTVNATSEINTQDLSIMYFGNSYNASYNNELLTETVCLFNGSYTFTIYDSAGDGNCCKFGNGYYKVLVGGVEIKSGGEYESEEETSFDAIQAPTVSPAPTSSPWPTAGPWITGAPTAGPTVICPSGETTLSVELRLSYSPESITYDVTDSTGAAIVESGNFTWDQAYTTSYREYCIPPGFYTITFYSSDGSGMDYGGYAVSVNDVPIFVGGNYMFSTEAKTFATPGTPTQAPTAESTVSCTADEVLFEATIVLDFYPTEVSWTLLGTALFFQGGPYLPKQKYDEVTEKFCLTQGEYTFTLTDAWGDGISGNCTLSLDGTEFVFIPGDFGFQSITEFSTSGALAPTTSPQPSASPTVSPQPTPRWTSFPTVAPSAAPTVNCAADESTFEVDIKFNYDPSTTEWDVADSSGAVLMSGQNYTYVQTSVHKELCLASGSYTFTIYDLSGFDGLCCMNGQGSYKLWMNGVVVQKGGPFDYQESTTIVAP